MQRRGFVLITALTMLVVLMALLTAYFTLTRIEISTTASTANSTTGFYAAEAGLNLRAEAVKGFFQSGTPPVAIGEYPSVQECGSTSGSIGSFGCWSAGNIQSRSVATSLRPADPATTAGTGTTGQVAPGEAFAGLRYTEFRYDLNSAAYFRDQPEAILGMRFKVRRIPLFQFMAFYDEDLELGPGPQMTINGPLHTNGNMYLSASNGDLSDSATLDINGQVSSFGNLYRGRKLGDAEQSGTRCAGAVNIRVSGTATSLPLTTAGSPSPGSGTVCPDLPVSNVAAYNGSVRSGNGPEGLQVSRLSVPRPDVFDPLPGSSYWDAAQLRIVLNLQNPGGPAIEVHTRESLPSDVVGAAARTRSPVLNVPATNLLNSSASNPNTCPGIAPLLGLNNAPVLGSTPNTRAVGYSQSFNNARERDAAGLAKPIQMLEVDMAGLLACIRSNSGTFGFNPDSAGLVFYFSVNGADSRVGCSVNAVSAGDRCVANNYGVRIRNSAQLNNAAAGMSIVTNQAAYIQGNFNSTNKKPAAILSDSLNILSSAWLSDTDDASCKGLNTTVCTDGPNAIDTTVNAAFLSGVDTTGGGAYNGGLQNYPRFHENWSGRTLSYRGSFISLDRPRYVNGIFSNQRYNPPNRVWSYETDFNDPSKLPPLTPTVTQLEQELFTREFEQGR